jgi:hypothetical protein
MIIFLDAGWGQPQFSSPAPATGKRSTGGNNLVFVPYSFATWPHQQQRKMLCKSSLTHQQVPRLFTFGLQP